MAAPRASCSPSRRSSASPGCSSSGSASTAIRLTGGEPTVRAHLPVLVEQARRRSASTSSLTTNGATLRLVAHDLAAAGPATGSTSRSTRCAASGSSRMTRRDELDRVLDGIDAAIEAGLRPGEGQRRARSAASTTTRSSTSPTFGRDQRRRGALHRVHAARRQRRLGRRRGRQPGRDRRRHRRRYPLEPVPARGAAPADRWRYLDGAGRRRRDPERHQAVLRRLRPGAPHRRGPVPHLPVRDSTSSTCGPSLRGGGSDDDLAAEIERAVGTKWAGHAIGQVTSSARSAP